MASLLNLFVYLFGVNVAYAATPQLDKFLSKLNNMIINPLIGLLFALALVYFLYGVAQFVVNGSSEEERTKGKMHMIYGVVGIAVMMGVWGILQVALRTFNIKGVDPEENKVNLEDYTPSKVPQLNP